MLLFHFDTTTNSKAFESATRLFFDKQISCQFQTKGSMNPICTRSFQDEGLMLLPFDTFLPNNPASPEISFPQFHKSNQSSHSIILTYPRTV